MRVKDIIQAIEAFAPPVYQESYDNSGLQVGSVEWEVSGVLIALDITEAVLEEARTRGCNMIVAHHPLLFSGLKRITGSHYIERIVQAAIKHDIALFAAHTNLDNVRNGVNKMICEKLGLQHTHILAAKAATLSKLNCFVPATDADRVREAMFSAGAGSLGEYTECSFQSAGTGTFKPGAHTQPAIGTPAGEREYVEEVRIEVLVATHQVSAVISALVAAHPYEEVAYDIIALQNANQEIGAGMLGELTETCTEEAFLSILKTRMKAECIRHTALLGRPVKKVAVCGGSGSFLLQDAIKAGADVFVTGDFKYHQFFDADGKILIADIGHYESEQFTTELLAGILKKKFPNFAPLLSELSNNPVKYFC